MKIWVISLLFFTLFIPVSANDSTMQKEAQAFFDEYIQLGNNFDPQIADLYADTALIHTFRRYPQGLNREMEMSGKQWKDMVTRVMPLAKSRNDRSTFSNIAISLDGKRVKIKADRFSEIKCSTDTGYYMIIEYQPNGRFIIIEEYMETQPDSEC